jgi:glycosyltransferase involved in cell wall biosynthesis
MNILYIWDADYPWDVRVEKICKTLTQYGHIIHIAARNLKKLPEYESDNGLWIHRLKAWKDDRINYVLSFPAFFSPVWKCFLDRIINDNTIDLIIVRDLPMAIAGIWAGRRQGIPVIFDMAEDYVSMLWDIWRVRKFQGFNLLVRNPYLAKYVERYAFRKSDHILVVVDEAKEVVIRGGGNPDKVTVVGNTPLIESFTSSTGETNDMLEMIRGRYSVIYTGGIQMGRGIQVVFDAIPEIIKVIPDFLFVIVGDGYATSQLKEMMYSKNIQDYVLWVGWVDHHKIFSYIRASRIGIIPHLTSDHVNTTIPNKIFDYMGLGLPVISSDAVPMKRILENERCGITFRSGDSIDLTRAIIELHDKRNLLGNNGKASVLNRYNWEIDKANLLRVIEGS